MHRFTSMDENASVACAGHMSVCSQVHSLLREGRGVEKAGYVCSVPPTCFCGRSSHRGNSTISSCSHRVAVLTGSQLQRDSRSMATWNFLSCFTEQFLFSWMASSDSHTLMYAYIFDNIMVVITVAAAGHFHSASFAGHSSKLLSCLILITTYEVRSSIIISFL